MPQWYVYILRSLTKGFTYIGSTNNLERRLGEHNSGFVQSTKAYIPLEIVAYIAVKTEKRARELEKYFKTGSGKAILKKRILTDEVLQGRT
jgi:predicted GIY-YIG superfamily endonuclease